MRKRDSDTLALELSHLFNVVSEATGKRAEVPEDSRVISSNLGGGEETLAAIHAIRMFDIAESTMPDIDVSSTPSGISVIEYRFMDRFFRKIVGMPHNWLLGRAVGYLAMKYPEEREKSPHLQQFYAGYGHFLESLRPELQLITLPPYAQDEFVINHFGSEEEQIAAIDFAHGHRSNNWGILSHLGSFWMMAFPDQFEEARRYCPSMWRALNPRGPEPFSPRVYEPRLRRTEGLMKLVKALVHEIYKDGVADTFEKESAAKFLNQRCEGFGTLDQQCVEAMIKDIERKDLLFHLASSNKLNGVSVPNNISYNGKQINVRNEILKVSEKTGTMKNLLRIFDGSSIDDESLNLILYAMSITGIRGKTNSELFLEPYGVSEDRLVSAGLHDSPEIQLMLSSMDYFRECNVPGVRELVLANPSKF